jgi:hypothetical protein
MGSLAKMSIRVASGSVFLLFRRPAAGRSS